MCHMTSGFEATVHAIELLACIATLSIPTNFMNIANFVPEVWYHSEPIRAKEGGRTYL